MPSYDYICPRCKHESEITKPMSDSDREEYCYHEECDGILVRVFAGQDSTFILKGSGWTGNNLTKKGRT